SKRVPGSRGRGKAILHGTPDRTMRKLRLPGTNKPILPTPAGFVSDLPTDLVAAFRATLEGVTTADLIVHVRDIVHLDSDAQYDDVRAILDSLGVNGPQDSDVKHGEGDEASDAVLQIEIWNKIDTADPDRRAQIEEMAARRADVAVISAATVEGVEAARTLMASQLTAQHRVERIFLGFDQGEAMAWLHARGEVLSDQPEGEGHVLTVRLDPADRARFERLWPSSVVQGQSPGSAPTP
ncbi:MAG: GTPase HflX, partial [Sphingopyxis sp.]|nr:GTPase HflX [Sphingopyxis sp.]